MEPVRAPGEEERRSGHVDRDPNSRIGAAGVRIASLSRLLTANAWLPLWALIGLLVAWQLGNELTRFIPAPVDVFLRLPEFLRQDDLLSNIASSVQRVLVGMAIALVAGTATAVLMVTNRRVEQVLETYVYLALGTPSVAAVLFALMAFGLSDTGVYVAVAVITYPFITIGIKDGARSVDRTLLDMCAVYRVGFLERQRQVLIPHIAPYLLASVRNAHALAWKVAIVGEVFLARDGIGGEFERAFDSFDLEEVILWLGVFLSVLFLIEYGVIRLLERRIYRWRPPQLAPTVRGRKA